MIRRSARHAVLGLASIAAAAGLFVASPAIADAGTGRLDPPYGSGSFGRWFTDRFGLPAYRYEIDERVAPKAEQPELKGDRGAWHQVGNDHFMANVYNHGYAQFWSQDREAQWLNQYDEANGHYAGGYGYLKIGDRIYDTLQSDQPAGALVERDFGVGYARRSIAAGPVALQEYVYAPFGDDPVLLHDVTLTNKSAAAQDVVWWEYWDANPVVISSGRNLKSVGTPRGMAAPQFDRNAHLLTVAQKPYQSDEAPLSIFLAAVGAPVSGFETRSDAFFGAGGRPKPDMTMGNAENGIAAPSESGQSGKTAMVLRSPVKLQPGQSVTLHYAYGAAHPEHIPALVRHYAGANSLSDSERSWRRWLPKSDFGPGLDWLGRELAWSAYAVRSASRFEEGCGHHSITQGGIFEYNLGMQIAYRDPLQHLLPMIYADPDLARETIRYAVQQQTPENGFIPYGRAAMCGVAAVGNEGDASSDMDIWTFLSVVEYVNATRNFGFLDERIPFLGGGSATLWEHLKLALRHQESFVGGPHGEYSGGKLGDWADMIPLLLGLTESTLLTAQVAYVYPRLADIADIRSDRDFANELRTRGTAAKNIVAKEWVAKGWYTRGYAKDKPLGDAVITSEPQSWAILAGIPTADQSALLTGNIRRYLSGVGAPPDMHGPAKIGSAISPAAADPDVQTKLGYPVMATDKSAYYGGTWYALNGTLTLALASLDGVVQGAKDYAWDELLRNTLARHAEAFPDHWDGIISIDDVCSSYYSATPENCGIGMGLYEGQVTHQPAWLLFDAIRLMGVEPTASGFKITPVIPLQRASLALPGIGIAFEPGMVRGYVKPEKPGDFDLDVKFTPTNAKALTTLIDGKVVAHTVGQGRVKFTAPARMPGAVIQWAAVEGQPPDIRSLMTFPGQAK